MFSYIIMYNRTKQVQKKGAVPPGLAAYQERKRNDKINIESEYDDESDEYIVTPKKTKRETYVEQPRMEPVKKMPVKRVPIKSTHIEKLIDDYELELYKIKEREKEIKRAINKLKKDI